VDILEDPSFAAGEVDTSFLTGRAITQPEPDRGASVAAALALAERDAAGRRVQRGVPVAWRNVVSQPQVTRLTRSSAPGAARTTAQADDPISEVEWYGGRDGYTVDGLVVVEAGPDRVVLECDGVRTAYDVAVAGDAVDVDAATGHVRFTVVPRFTDPADAVASGSLLAPMPGTVVRLAVTEGDGVEAGQSVLVLEAMKMQHTVAAPHAGTVTRISVQPGAQVAANEVLAVVEPSSVERSRDHEEKDQG
jgi:propionyl-CoA carboxylase alpha chain